MFSNVAIRLPAGTLLESREQRGRISVMLLEDLVLSPDTVRFQITTVYVKALLTDCHKQDSSTILTEQPFSHDTIFKYWKRLT